uniref:Uncharacterized protein n=1 Tax=Ditylenchus dipsaci TaxID=166011 RepID=A0A915E8T0_9BILA
MRTISADVLIIGANSISGTALRQRLAVNDYKKTVLSIDSNLTYRQNRATVGSMPRALFQKLNGAAEPWHGHFRQFWNVVHIILHVRAVSDFQHRVHPTRPIPPSCYRIRHPALVKCQPEGPNKEVDSKRNQEE